MLKYFKFLVFTYFLISPSVMAQDLNPSIELFEFGEIAKQPKKKIGRAPAPPSQSSSFLTAPSFFEGQSENAEITIIEPQKSAVILPPRRPKKLKASKAFLDRKQEQAEDANTEFSDLSSKEILSHIEPASGAEDESETVQVKATPMHSKKTETISVPYISDEYKFDVSAREIISSEILTKASKEPNNKIKLYAYANKANKTDVEAKRLSLRRALDIRDFLVSKDIDSKRIAIFPMGYKESAQKQSNRFDKVDVVFTDS